MVVEKGDDTHIGRVRSPTHRTTNASYAIPPGATTSTIQSEEVQGIIESRSPSPPHLYLPPVHPPRSHQTKHDEARRLVTNADTVGSMAASRPRDAPDLDVPSRQFHSHTSRMSPPKEIPLSSSLPDRYPQRPNHPNHPTPPQRGFEETALHQFGVMDHPENQAGHTQGAHLSYQGALASPTIVPPSSPSAVSVELSPIWHSTRTKGTGHYAEAGSHLRSGRREPDVDRVRAPGAGEDYTRDLEIFMSKSQEEDGASPYSEIFFESPMAVLLAAGSVNGSGAATPLSDQPSILAPWRAFLNGQSFAAEQKEKKEVQDRPTTTTTNLQFAAIPHTLSPPPTIKPAPGPGPGPGPGFESKEGLLHCDELNVPPRKPLSRMEKAILRRVEFGLPSVDLSNV
jgi:hypothetical protein